MSVFFVHFFVFGINISLSLHFVVSLSEKRRVAHRETTFLFLTLKYRVIISCLMFNVSCLMFNVSCLIFNV